MSYGPAVEVRWEDREVPEFGHTTTVAVRYPLEIVEIGSDGSLHENFRAWRERHPEAEIIDIQYGVASEGSILVIYREREDAPAEAGA